MTICQPTVQTFTCRLLKCVLRFMLDGVMNRSIQYRLIEMETAITSLQKIVTHHDRNAIRKQITTLFSPKTYPQFQLEQLAQHRLHLQNEQFRFFMDVLEEWNRKVQQRALSNHSELYYRQNIFIYNSLLHCIRADNSENSLPHLYQWFSATRGAKNRPLGIKSQKTPMKDEEWEVRNTFKSNLPSEINSYKRRQLWSDIDWHQGDKENEEAMKAEESQEGLKALTDKRLLEIENGIVRTAVQAKQLSAAQGRWVMTNTRKQQEGVRCFLDGKFDANKTYFTSKARRVRDPLLTQVSEQRVRSSFGIRPKIVQPMKRNFTANGTRQQKKQRNARSSKNIRSIEEQQFSMGFQGIRIVDGVGLHANPFDKKLKKKRAKK